MKKNLFLLFVITLFCCHFIEAQTPQRGTGTTPVRLDGKVTGKAIDADTKQPVEYANIAIFKLDSSLVNGTVTNEKGNFVLEKLQEGKYFLKASFIGYEPKYADISITKDKPNIQLGNILMNSTAKELEGVEIVAERSMIEYKLDKRVVNVDKNLVTGGGTATDVLENIPSVAVDNDGNITLRGSSSVKILIDGRPAELLGSDMQVVLEQIQANEIENVEIVTNPSARYNPEGSSGIINIKLKENKIRGMNGTVGVNFGSALPKFTPTGNVSASLNYKTEKWLLFGSVEGNLRSRANEGYTDTKRLRGDSIYSDVHQESENDNKSFGGSIRLGGEYSFNKYNALTLTYQYRNHLRFGESSSESHDRLGAISDYKQENETDANSNNHSISLNYRKTFAEKDRELTVDASFSTNNGQDNSTQNYESDIRSYERRSDAPSNRQYYSVSLNYIHPFSESTRLETGYAGDFNRTDNNNRYYLMEGGSEYFDAASSNHFIFSENVNAFYATLGHQFTKKLSAQAGLRYEYVSNDGTVETISKTNISPDPYHSLYPSLHLSYGIDQTQSVQVSYSRRVRRPSMWNLSPYKNVTDPESVRFGNPGLDPQYTNSFEVSYNKNFSKANIFSSVYVRHTDKMMSHVSFPWTEEDAIRYGFEWQWTPDDTIGNRMASTYMNVGTSLNYGLELIFDYQLTKWWKFNISGNLYQSEQSGVKSLGLNSVSSFLWNTRFSTIVTLPKEWTIQFSGRYNAPRKNLQGKSFANYMFDLAVKKDVMNKKGTLSIRINDIFATGGYRYETELADRKSYTRRDRLSPYVSVGFTYRMNKGERIKQSKNRNTNGEDMDSMPEEF